MVGRRSELVKLVELVQVLVKPSAELARLLVAATSFVLRHGGRRVVKKLSQPRDFIDESGERNMALC